MLQQGLCYSMLSCLRGVAVHLFYCDETNLEERAGDFLIYGGLMIEGATAQEFSAAVDQVRDWHGVPRDYRLKFNPGPEGLSHAQFIALKQEVLETAVRFGARLVVYVTLHDVARNADEARRYGINTVCYHFHCILNRLGGAGLVLIDQFNDAGNAIAGHLRDKFTVGLTDMPGRGEVRLPNIVGFHYSAVGQSHFPSIVDLALGSLRFAINAHTRGQDAHLPTATALLGILSPLFWRQAAGVPVPELGFIFSPRSVRNPGYRATYERLKAFLEEGGIPTAQAITGVRTY